MTEDRSILTVECFATNPVEQRHGYASRLLEALPPRLADFELAALCPATEGLYQRLEWRPGEVW